MNGALEATPTMMDENMGKDNYILLAFNMDTETCREITPPKFCDKGDNGLWHNFLGVFKESISLFSSCPPYDCFRWEIWVMNERSMVLRTLGLSCLLWKWSFRISRTLRLTKDGKVLAENIDGEELLLYDHKSRHFKSLPIPVPESHINPIHVTTCIGSLILLDESKEAKSDVSDIIAK